MLRIDREPRNSILDSLLRSLDCTISYNLWAHHIVPFQTTFAFAESRSC